MSRKNAPNVTAEVMKKAWFMHNKKLSTADIASLLSMSKNTVCRIIEIMETANKGDITALNALYNGGYVTMKKYACEFFNIAQGGGRRKHRRSKPCRVLGEYLADPYKHRKQPCTAPCFAWC